MRKIRLSIFAIILTINLVVGFAVYSNESPKNGGDEDVLAQIEIMMQVLQLIRKNYVDIDKVTTKELLQGALKGMTDKLDPHSVFLPPANLQELVEDSEGEFGGIGITVHNRDNRLYVVEVVDETPAAKAGILAGDVIVSVDGTPLKEADMNDALLRMRGKPGTKVKIGVERPSTKGSHEFELVRSMIPLPNVIGAQVIKDTSIGYVRVTQFMEPTARKLEKVLRDFSKKEVTAIILDLRGNPGGLLESAVEVCSFFLPENKLIATIKRHSDTRSNRESENFREHFSHGGYKVSKDVKLLILIDGNSASASEITAGCLRDHKRAVLLGEKSYGKGSVQNVIELGDGSAVKLTIARYYTPDPARPTIDGNGVQPDIYEPAPPMFYGGRKNAEGKREDILNDSQIARAVEILKSLSVFSRK